MPKPDCECFRNSDSLRAREQLVDAIGVASLQTVWFNIRMHNICQNAADYTCASVVTAMAALSGICRDSRVFAEDAPDQNGSVSREAMIEALDRLYDLARERILTRSSDLDVTETIGEG